ncbi:NACHT domain-containing protein [Phaeacidiphilus oryzae]|uniref:NACHT domain-containing protein n=1 Tax=Phaeacidiphilus oryzae TaxID=348818 RepID=UPI000689E961|nr:NACHT domain-containing protein [Phaeacidiphilus oryzae]
MDLHLAAVLGPPQGSGCLLTPRLVLTAAHVLAGRDTAEVSVPGGNGPQSCRVVHRVHDERTDIALLAAAEPLTACSCRFEGWARSEDAQDRPARAVGFPRVGRDARGSLDTEEFTGRLKPLSSALRGTLVLEGDQHPPLATGPGTSPWAGMSGAPVLVGDLLAGVVREDPAGWAHSRLVVGPLEPLLADEEFTAACRRHGYAPARVPLPRPAAPADFDSRLRDYLARQAGRLNVIGIGEETWPLDAGYLSLELLDRSPEPVGPDPEPDPAPSLPVASTLRAEQALSGRSRVLLRGSAGSGKTTLLQWLTVATARRRLPEPLSDLGDCVPLMLRLRALVRRPELPAPEELLSAVAKPLSGLPEAAGWVTGALTEGRALLLIDGVDEVPEADRERTRAWLADLLAAFPYARYVVTTRPSAVREGWLAAQEFTELELQPMSRADVARFIARWHAAAAPDGRLDALRDALTSAVAAKPDLGRLATNPLMCALMCALDRDRRGFLPDDRMELYAAALEMLLVRRDRERAITPVTSGLDLTLHQQTLLLQRLAHWLITNGEAEMSSGRALRIIGDLIPSLRLPDGTEPPAILDHLLLRSGLLRRPTSDSVDFVHRTFQDYLGSQSLIDNADLGLLVRNAHDDQWRDVLRMAVHHARPYERAELLDRLLRRAAEEPPELRDRLHLVAAACLEHATALAPETRERVERAAATLIPPRDAQQARDLARCGPVVLDLLPGPDGLTDEQALAVVTTATTLGRERAIHLLARYTQHPSIAVRAQLASSWAQFDQDQYAREIIARLWCGPDPETGAVPLFVVDCADDLAFLASLGGRERVRVEGGIEVADLADLPTPALRSLDLSDNPYPLDLGLLRRARRLDRLALLACGGGTDLRPLAELRALRSLVIPADTSVTGLDVLAKLTRLRFLNLNHALPEEATTLEGLPPGLDHLILGTATLTRTLLRGLERQRRLSRFRFPGETIEPGPDRLPLTRLPGLRHLEVLVERGDLIARSPVLPQVQRLTLLNPHRLTDLAPLAAVYPGLRRLDLPAEHVPDGDPLPGVAISALAHRVKEPAP